MPIKQIYQASGESGRLVSGGRCECACFSILLVAFCNRVGDVGFERLGSMLPSTSGKNCFARVLNLMPVV
jgi:hypothetical protein